jgi:RNA polymerase sigma-70 factor, ECF subfamily
VQDALPALVLSPEAISPSAMSNTPIDSESGKGTTATSDERLMLDFSKGAAEAFTELFGRYKQPLFGFFRRRLADAGQAEELTQETFLAIVRGASRYQPRALFRTYLYAIAFRILRAHRRKQVFRAAFLGQRKQTQDPAGRDATEAALLLRQALRKLHHTDREILMLREFEALSYAEISELLNLPLNTVRSRLFRARVALKELLDEPAPVAAAGKLAGFEEQV